MICLDDTRRRWRRGDLALYIMGPGDLDALRRGVDKDMFDDIRRHCQHVAVEDVKGEGAWVRPISLTRHEASGWTTAGVEYGFTVSVDRLLSPDPEMTLHWAAAWRHRGNRIDQGHQRLGDYI